jgi:hypothetical protein
VEGAVRGFAASSRRARLGAVEVRCASHLGSMGEMFGRKTVALTPLVRYRTGELGNSGAEPGSATDPGWWERYILCTAHREGI